MFNMLRFRNEVALIDEEIQYTYGEIVEIYSQVFKDIKTRSLVGIIAGNNIESIIAYMWALNAKSVPLMLGAEMWGLAEILRL